MSYITEYEICSLLFLIIVIIRFFSMRKFHNRSNRLFGIILHCAFAILVLDITSAYFIRYADSVAPWLNTAVNMAFYILQLAITGILLLYVIVLSGRKIGKASILMFIPLIAAELVLLSNPFTRLIFYFDDTPSGRVFTHGGLFVAFYLVGFLYIIFTMLVVLRLRRSFRKSEFKTILGFVLIIISAMVIQSVFPRVLLNGTAMTIAIFMMFLTLQNPGTMLDSITGTFNYTALMDYLRRQISEKHALWIMAVDVGGIRRINSIMGIRAGNELLENVGKYINVICNNRATAFRMIGTRFIIFSDSFRTQKTITADITERFKQPWQCGDAGVVLLATIRYCEQKNKFSSPEDVINLIDLAYAKTSEEGFGTTKPVDAEQLEQFRRNGQIRDALSRAITSGKGFYLNYQPLYSVKEQKFCTAEALLRLNDPELGTISPAEFIPVAESTDMIYQIDKIVVKMACDFLKAHPGLSDAGFKMLDINLSATEFNNDTEKVLSTILENIETIEDKICFEVTETAVTTRREVLSDFMHRLIEKGVRFAIDDFGTGYANITQLAKLPFSVVKLDKLFVLQNSDKEASIIKDLINMFDHIGLMTVFEGIENEQQASFAKDIGIGHIQGYYYSHPLTGDEFAELIISQNK